MNYKLSEFKSWLANNPTKQGNLPHWEDYLRIISHSELTILPVVFKPNTLVKTGDGQRLGQEYQSILTEWKKEKDEESTNRLAELETEVEQLNIALLHQQKISSQSTQAHNPTLTKELKEVRQALANKQEELTTTKRQAQAHTELLTIKEQELTNQQKTILILQQRNDALKSQLSKQDTETTQLNEEILTNYQILEHENSELKQSLNNLNNLAWENTELLKQSKQLKAQIANLHSLLNQNEPTTNWLVSNKKFLIAIGGISLISYLLFKNHE